MLWLRQLVDIPDGDVPMSRSGSLCGVVAQDVAPSPVRLARDFRNGFNDI